MSWPSPLISEPCRLCPDFRRNWLLPASGLRNGSRCCPRINELFSGHSTALGSQAAWGASTATAVRLRHLSIPRLSACRHEQAGTRIWPLRISPNSNGSAACAVGSKPCVLTRRRNFPFSRSIVWVDRGHFHWLGGSGGEGEQRLGRFCQALDDLQGWRPPARAQRRATPGARHCRVRQRRSRDRPCEAPRWHAWGAYRSRFHSL